MLEMNQHCTNTEMLEMNHQQEEEPLVLGGNQDLDFDRASPEHEKPRGKLYYSGLRMAAMLLAVMFSVILVLQVVLVIMIATKCVCQVAGHNNDTSFAVVGGEETCNATQMQACFGQIIKRINDSSDDILYSLHELQSKNKKFQDNATKTMENTEDSLLHIINTLSNHKDSSISTSSVVDDILIGVNELSLCYDDFVTSTQVSCKIIKEKLPNSPSGYYHVNNRDIYCNMDELCGSGGGWTRLAYLDMTDSTVNCPDELQYIDPPPDGVRVCQRPNSQSAGCSSPVKFPSNGISYSEICGRVIGYQYGSPDGVNTLHGPLIAHNDLNSYYVDGISLTRGSPRQHVWTFMAAPYENLYDIHYNCPCNTPPGGAQDVQSFVGSHYFCESGNPVTDWIPKVYTSDPLWDGEGCGSQEGECCNAPGLPWFHRQYNTTTTDSMDMRICGNEQTSDENTPVSFYEIFVK